jgi:tellurite resistance protein
MSTQANDTMTPAQVTALVAAMLAVAHVDGVQPAEEQLIRTFYEESATAGMPAFDQVGHTHAQANQLLAAAGGGADFAEQLVLMCFMTAYADGHMSDGERALVLDLAKQSGVAEARAAELLQQVKDTLIGSLAHLPDAESVAALSKTL